MKGDAAERGDEVVLGRRRASIGAKSEEPRQFQRRCAHPAGGSVDQERLSRFEPRAALDHRVGREVVKGKEGGGLVAEIGRHRDDKARFDVDRFPIGAHARNHPRYPLPADETRIPRVLDGAEIRNLERKAASARGDSRLVRP